MASFNLALGPHQKLRLLQVSCRRKEKERNNFDPYKVIEITPPPKNLGIRCFPPGIGTSSVLRIPHRKDWWRPHNI